MPKLIHSMTNFGCAFEVLGNPRMTNGTAFFWISEKEANLKGYAEIFGNVSPGIPVPFDFPHGISGTFGKTVSFSEIQHFPGFLRISYGGPQLSRQSPFTHGKIDINFATAKSNSPRQNQFHHGKVIFTHSKIHLTTAKSFWLTCLRDPVSSQSAMGVNPTWRSSSRVVPWLNMYCSNCGNSVLAVWTTKP